MIKELIIASSNRTSGTSENFNINSNISSILQGTIKEIKLLEASIPMTFNNIAGGSFIINGLITGSSTITLIGGKYSGTSLASTIQALIVKPPQTYTVSISLANQLIISSTEQFSLDFTGSTLDIGFSGLSGVASSHTGNAVKLQPDAHILICSSQVRGLDNGPIVLKQTLTQNNIIHAVPICGTLINYRSSDSDPWVKMLPLPLTNFFLSFQSGFPVQMNGGEWTFKLLVKF